VKIAIEDKLPLILDDRDYFKDHGFRVFAPSGSAWREIDPDEVDWTRVSENHFPYRLRQDPGPQNALGRIKFQVPNRHDIYLHDTPSRGLFARTERTFSSGCIRVERALDLAERLLAADPAWTRARIEETIATGATVSVPLPAPLPVYLLYWTAWVDRDGLLQFREDVYGRDTALLKALAQPVAAP
jgi:murein L,D-transpeptidase YcbB/YkuD